MVYLQGPLALPNNETVRLRMGRSTLAIKAKRSITASVRGAFHRTTNSIPCTASLERLQEIMALAPPQVPRSARLAVDTESHNHLLQKHPEQQKSLPSSPQIQLKSDVPSIPPLEENLLPNLLLSGSSSMNHNDGLDQALILGPERRDGGSGREVSFLFLYLNNFVTF